MKKICTIALVAAMVLALIPATALAATTEAGNASELVDAIANAEDGDTIQLTADIVVTEEIQVTKTLTIDMNGHNISGTRHQRRTRRFPAPSELRRVET